MMSTPNGCRGLWVTFRYEGSLSTEDAKVAANLLLERCRFEPGLKSDDYQRATAGTVAGTLGSDWIDATVTFTLSHAEQVAAAIRSLLASLLCLPKGKLKGLHIHLSRDSDGNRSIDIKADSIDLRDAESLLKKIERL